MNEPDGAVALPLFEVSNHHSASSGKPPALDGDERGTYVGYFENELREQYVYVFDRATARATLRAGDVGLGRTFSVVEGEAIGLVLGEAEALWVRACWGVTGGSSRGQ